MRASIVGIVKLHAGMRISPSEAGGGGEPGRDAGGVTGDVDDGGVDRVDAPVIGEGCFDVGAGETVWSPVAGLAVAEAEHEVAAAAGGGCAEGSDVREPVGGIEDVEKTAVEHGVEGLAELVEPAGVVPGETCGQTAVGGLSPPRHQPG